MRARRSVRMGVIVSFAIATAACGVASAAPSPTPYAWHGATLVKPVSMPDVPLIDDQGRPYNLPEQSAGYVTLVYVGYTHCPDVCPTTMAQTAAVLRLMPANDRSRVHVLFITDDPERDTPQVLSKWLANFHSSFIGLIPQPMQYVSQKGAVALVEEALHITPSVLDSPNPDGGYGVEHSAFVLAFTRDGLAHISFVEGIKTQGEVSDLTRLVQQGFR